MAQPIRRTAISAAAETAESGVGGGLLGGLAGIIGGSLLGAAVVAVLGGAVGLIGGYLLGGAVGILDFDFFSLTAKGAAEATAGFLGSWGATLGGITGGLGGAYCGGIAGGVIGAVKGATNKVGNINADERMANGVEKSKQMQQMQQVASIREQAADEFTRVGYEQGARDAQMAIMQQLQQAALAQQETEKNKSGFVDKLAKERGVDASQLAAATHAEQAKASQEAANQAVKGA